MFCESRETTTNNNKLVLAVCCCCGCCCWCWWWWLFVCCLLLVAGCLLSSSISCWWLQVVVVGYRFNNGEQAPRFQKQRLMCAEAKHVAECLLLIDCWFIVDRSLIDHAQTTDSQFCMLQAWRDSHCAALGIRFCSSSLDKYKQQSQQTATITHNSKQ